MTKRTNLSAEGSIVSPILTPIGAITEEIWKDIEGFNGIYRISSLGRVRTTIRRGCNVEFLKPMYDKKGYQFVDLRKDGKRYGMKIHRLVAMAFIPNPQGYNEVNHKDENKANNNINNLEWCSRLYNIHYGTGIERMAEKASMPVNQYGFDGKLLKRWDSVKDASESLGFDGSCICRACNGREKMRTYRGYIWVYANDPIGDKRLRSAIDWVNTEKGRSYGKPKRVIQMDKDGCVVNIFDSTRDAMRKTGVHCAMICRAAKLRVLSRGFYWRYAEGNLT